MSYRNPTMIQPADPLAFSKGFEQAFSQQQNAFQAELEKRERLAKEQDDALAAAYSMADMSPIYGFDTAVSEGAINMFNDYIDSNDFATADASKRAKILQDIKLAKANFAKLGEIMAVDNSEWDLRNDPKLTALRTAILKGEKPQIKTKGLDFELSGSWGNINLKDLGSTRVFNKAAYQEDLDAKNDSYFKEYQQAYEAAYRSGKTDSELAELRKVYKDRYMGMFSKYLESNEDLSQYVKFNVGKSFDINESISNMFDSVETNIIDPGLILNRPVKEVKEQKLPTGLTKEQSSTALSNILNIDESTRDENNIITSTSPFYELRIKGPNDVVPMNYRFRKIEGKYFFQKPGMGTPDEITEEELYNLLGHSNEYKQMIQGKQRLETQIGLQTGNFAISENFGKQRPVKTFDGSN